MSNVAETYKPATCSAVEKNALKRYVDAVSQRSFRFAQPEVKWLFHRDSRMVLRIIARKLDLKVGSYSIRSFMGALSEPGCITLQLPAGSIQIMQASLYRDIQIKIRRYGGPGHRMLVASHSVPVAALLDADYLVKRIKPILSL
jgi:hypothetical protein